MSKLLFFALVAVAVYLLLRPARQSMRREQGARAVGENMVACARCGLHVPKSESVEADGRHYCCPEHRRLDAGDPGRD